jgi:hypothetical protein
VKCVVSVRVRCVCVCVCVCVCACSVSECTHVCVYVVCWMQVVDRTHRIESSCDWTELGEDMCVWVCYRERERKRGGERRGESERKESQLWRVL